MTVVAPVLVGFAFGWVLQKGRLGRYETIVNVFRFTDLTVVKFLLTGLLVAMVTVQGLVALGLATTLPIPTTFALGNLLGGAIFGGGMAFAGFCPGTVAAGAGEGRLDYLVPGSLGLTMGALLFGGLYPTLYPRLVPIGNVGAVTVPVLAGLDPWLVIVAFGEVTLLLFYLLERGPGRQPKPTRVTP
jgi:hypothetical protein